MDGLVDRKLDLALGGDGATLAGFGFERLTTAGRDVSGAFECEQGLSILGTGKVAYSRRRSIADASAEEIGLYGSSEAREEVLELLRLIRKTPWEDLPPCELEPHELKTRFTLVIGGAVRTYTAGSDPDALEPLRPLTERLDRLEETACRNPMATLGLRLELPTSASAGSVDLPVTLRLRNSGPSGYWITHPASQASLPPEEAIEAGEVCTLSYALEEEPEPGVTPLPPKLEDAPLRPDETDGPQLLWVPGQGEVPLKLTASVRLSGPGTYLARVAYSTYEGADRVAGQPRLRGHAFSNEARLTVA